MSAPCPELACALESFAEEAPLVRRLFLADRAFRSACEDYRLALEGLAAFRRLPDGRQRAEFDDYQRVVRELEAEMRDMIRAARSPACRPWHADKA
ncbi:hypothetical protein DFH01_12775 [Falsiroseomonas bella]|uniref:Uncharacterized protein n=1 Tax=Falsiroseomonas bella TaxID=2184016 RepID=A0A317FES0_9PROT|nr:hypothetical protein DFH01_12775 [Falsiroseomonas bella]